MKFGGLIQSRNGHNQHLVDLNVYRNSLVSLPTEMLSRNWIDKLDIFLIHYGSMNIVSIHQLQR